MASSVANMVILCRVQSCYFSLSLTHQHGFALSCLLEGQAVVLDCVTASFLQYLSPNTQPKKAAVYLSHPLLQHVHILLPHSLGLFQSQSLSTCDGSDPQVPPLTHEWASHRQGLPIAAAHSTGGRGGLGWRRKGHEVAFELLT